MFDVHLKDKKVIATPRGDDSHDTFIGEGDANLRPFLKALEEAHYNGAWRLRRITIERPD